MSCFQIIFRKTGPKGLFLFVLPVCQFFLAFPVVAQNQTLAELENQLDPMALYDRMLASKLFYDYEGSMTYEQGGQLQSFSVNSIQGAQGVEQKISHLDGPDSFYHMSFDPACTNFVGVSASQLSNYYNFYTRSEVRVAGLEGIEIVLSPIDKYRNGFQFVAEKETGLMLRSIVLTPDRRVVERTQFVTLEYQARDNEQITDDLSENAVAVGEAVMQEQELVPEEIESSLEAELPNEVFCDQLSIDNGWRASWVPEGFELLESQLDDDRASLVYGDGLSVFTIFIESVLETFLPPSNAQRGATVLHINYLSSSTETYLVSVVGEIPLATAERVLSSLRRE